MLAPEALFWRVTGILVGTSQVGPSQSTTVLDDETLLEPMKLIVWEPPNITASIGWIWLVWLWLAAKRSSRLADLVGASGTLPWRFCLDLKTTTRTLGALAAFVNRGAHEFLDQTLHGATHRGVFPGEGG